MSVKRIIAYIVCLIIVAVALQAVLPSVGIPQAQMLPPTTVYASAKGRTMGVITDKPTKPSANPFRVGTIWYFVEYAFTATAPPLLGGPQPGTKQRYTGSVRVEKGVYSAVQIGQRVPIRYETTYPIISGIDAPNAGRSTGPGSALFSVWMLWTLATLFLAYLLYAAISPYLKQENL